MSVQHAARRVLLVDDEEALVWSLASRLSKAFPQDEFETAHDGESALAMVEERAVDLLVADIRMPGMSGIDLVLAARAQLPQLPVILMTAFKTADLQRLSLGPYTRLIEKPFGFEILLQLVERALVPPPVGFSGAVSVQTLPDIVQLYALSSATGLLTIRHGDLLSEIWFEQGHIRHAAAAGALGDEAVYATMAWSGGEFSMRMGARTAERSVRSSWQELLMESCRRIDEGQRDGSPGERTGWTLTPPSVDDIDFASVFPDFDTEPDSFELSLKTPPLPVSMTREVTMNIKESLAKLTSIDGFVGAALVDSESGMLLGHEGGGSLNLEIAAASNTEVVRAKRKAMQNLGLKDAIEDILITLGKQYHLIRPLRSRPGVFYYVALDRSRANLAMARIAIADVEKEIQF